MQTISNNAHNYSYRKQQGYNYTLNQAIIMLKRLVLIMGIAIEIALENVWTCA
jgi:hypothetical protein